MKLKITALILAAALLLCSCKKADISQVTSPGQSEAGITVNKAVGLEAEDIPDYSGKPYIVINKNTPDFKQSELKAKPYEHYAELDRYGRCRESVACIGKELMPKDERETISEVKPTGWHSIRFSFIDGESLYNRCHLIGFQLTGENANEKNLITGTRYLNIEGMLPFENMTAEYIRETGNHVLYRVTPIYSGTELVARGVQMEAYSVEDVGRGLCFNVFCYNVQPNVKIDYKTGEAEATVKETTTKKIEAAYVINKKSGKIHRPDCSGVKTMSDKNKLFSNESVDELIAEGYTPCGECRP